MISSTVFLVVVLVMSWQTPHKVSRFVAQPQLEGGVLQADAVYWWEMRKEAIESFHAALKRAGYSSDLATIRSHPVSMFRAITWNIWAGYGVYGGMVTESRPPDTYGCLMVSVTVGRNKQ